MEANLITLNNNLKAKEKELADNAEAEQKRDIAFAQSRNRESNLKKTVKRN